GGTAPGQGNTIAYNDVGVTLELTAGTGNTIRGNAISSNGGLGIDLGLGYGVTPNDTGDTDTGPNGLQNFPVLSAAMASARTHVAGTLNSKPNATFTIDIYASVVPDGSGYGEGQHYLGSVDVHTDASGNSSPFSFDFNGDLTGQYITATATGIEGTSEFSRAL